MPPRPKTERPCWIANARSPGWITDTVARIAENPAPRWWWAAFVSCAGMALMLAGMILHLLMTGVGVWGVNHPVMWGWDIVNFVWWIGIGHAGTLISAVLCLLRQQWRTSINRAAEAMTLFAVLCAAIYPVIHVGRMWFSWWLLPIPNANAVWPQFHSPLMWDVFAIGTYFTVSLCFWCLGLVPDLAVMRDRARSRSKQFVYGLLALGWTGSNRQWSHYEKTYLILAGLATALVVSVHSIVSLDFAAAQVPGWHSTIFPPYFVAGAIFSGMGMVLTLVIPLRSLLKLEDLITARHVDAMCKITLAAGCLVAYSYAVELFAVWQGGLSNESNMLRHRAFGPYAWAFWTMLACNVALPQLFWFKKVRIHLAAVFGIALAVNLGMWLERFVIVVVSLHRDFLPANWGYYRPTAIDVLTFLGTMGLFGVCFLLFLRFLPMMAVAELKGVRASEGESVPDEQAPSDATPSSSVPEEDALGLMAEFPSASALLHAAGTVRAAGFTRWDVFTPFPVKGMDRAMGLKPSPVGWFAFAGGAAGFAAGMGMVFWMNAVDYPLVAGGKPFFSPFSAFLPAFELAVLFGVLGALAGWLRLAGLPRWHQPLFLRPRFAAATRDRFFLVIEASDPKFSEPDVRRLLESSGTRNIETVRAASAPETSGLSTVK